MMPSQDNLALARAVGEQTRASQTSHMQAALRSCACRRVKKLATPPSLSCILGQLFVEHAGIPVISARCDTSTCISAQSSHVHVEYWFPLGVLWSQIVSFHINYQANLGPSLQLRTLCRLPDPAPAVQFRNEWEYPGNAGAVPEG